MTPLPGLVIADRYRLDRRLSEGGMGSVWLATHLELEAPVAVKFMHARLADSVEARGRFTREARAAAQIRSPHVVHIYDHGIDDGTPFIVMEYLEGEDLGQRLKRVGQLPEADAIRICGQVCRGLERAHALGIVHRDLKPANLFLCSDGEDTVKLLDFGIAKEVGREQLSDADSTTTGTLLGSPQYLSPEQARGFAVDHRADLWSLAVILFRTLTGRKLFDSRDVGDLIVRICSEPIPSARSFRPELPPAVDGFFGRALGRNREDRFPSAAIFAEAFAQALATLAPPLDSPSLPSGAGSPSSSPSLNEGRAKPLASAESAGDAPAGLESGPGAAPVGARHESEPRADTASASASRGRRLAFSLAALAALAAAGALLANRVALWGAGPADERADVVSSSVGAPSATSENDGDGGPGTSPVAADHPGRGTETPQSDAGGSGGAASEQPDDASAPNRRPPPRRPPAHRPPGKTAATSSPANPQPDLGY